MTIEEFVERLNRLIEEALIDDVDSDKIESELMGALYRLGAPGPEDTEE